MSEQPDSGGEPTALVECTVCGEVYPAQGSDDDEFRPIGVEDECACGSGEFVPVTE